MRFARRTVLATIISSLILLSDMFVEAQDVQKSGGASATQIGPQDWPWWRGLDRNGIAAAQQSLPRVWSETENVKWKAPVPGKGHGSACVVGDHVYLMTADHDLEVQFVLCYQRDSGKELWRTEVHRGGFDKKGNSKSSLASGTPACDGERVYVNFYQGGAIHASALSRDGKLLWTTKITNFTNHQGYGASPAVYEGLVIIGADNKGAGSGAIAALEQKTGREVWRVTRPSVPNYTSPIILKVAGRDQLLFTGCDLVSSFNPLTGQKLWEMKGATTECVTSTVTDGQLIFTSGGYPTNHISAVKADGTGAVAWQNGSRVYVPSMLVKDGALYAVLDAGVAMCWEASSGKELWKGRISGTFSSSPVIVGDVLYATNEAGHTYLLKAQASAFELIGENQLGDEVFATPTICGSRIYTRVAKQIDGRRQEFLYCLGSK